MPARQEWFTPQQLAGLPGMPTTDRRSRSYLEKNLVVSRPKGSGKGREYSRASLPKETQAHLDELDLQAVLKHLPVVVEPEKPARALIPAAQTLAADSTEADRLRAVARMQVLRAMADISKATGMTTRSAAAELLQRARQGGLRDALLNMLRRACDERGRAAQAAPGADGLPARRTLERWAAAQSAGADLVPRPSAQIDLRVRGWYGPLFALTDRPQKPTLKWAHEQLLAAWQPEWADPAGAQPPSYDQVVAAYAKRSRVDQLRGRHTGSALRSQTFYQHRTYEGMDPGTEVHADGWNTHFTAPHPVTGEFVTYEVWHFHDVATRYVTPLAIGLTEKADLILEGLQACIRVLGVMAIWQTDHTGSVKGKRVMEERAGLADRLGISVVHPAEVGNSQANGMAENFNTWLDRESRELATYQHPERMDSGTFVRVRRLTNAMVKATSNPAERARLRREAVRLGKGLVFDSHAEALAWLQARADRWNSHPCRALPRQREPMSGCLVHLSPQQALDAARAAGWAPMLLPEHVLVDQFRPHYRKTVTRGTVCPFGGMRYHHEVLAAHEGDEVLVSVAPDDPSQVWVKDLQGRLIAQAKFVAAVGPRTESMREHSERKRAEAQIRLREQQIDTINARVGVPVIDAVPSGVLELPPVGDLAPRWREPELMLPPLAAQAPSWREPELMPPPLRPAAPQREREPTTGPEAEPPRMTLMETYEHLQRLTAERTAREQAARGGAGGNEQGSEGADTGINTDSAPEKKVAWG